MSRLAYLPWCQAIADILGTYTCPTRDLELMFAGGLSPVEAAAEIAIAPVIAQIEKELNR